MVDRPRLLQLRSMSSGLAPAPLPDVVDGWRSAIEDVSAHASPCRYLAPAKWAVVREDALAFCDRFGAEAHRLGWTAPDLFGVDPEPWTLRVGISARAH
jgi:hypothetical protein